MKKLKVRFSTSSTISRIEYYLSLLWIVIVPFFAVPYSGEAGGHFEHFLWWGSFPLLLYWGVVFGLGNGSKTTLRSFQKCLCS